MRQLAACVILNGAVTCVEPEILPVDPVPVSPDEHPVEREEEDDTPTSP